MNNIQPCCLCFRISYKCNTHVNPSSTCTVLAQSRFLSTGSFGFCHLPITRQISQLLHSVPWSAANKRQGCGERHFYYSEREQFASVGRARMKTLLQDKVSSGLLLGTHSPRNKKFPIKSPLQRSGQSYFSYCTPVWGKQESKFLLKKYKELIIAIVKQMPFLRWGWAGAHSFYHLGVW